MYGKRNQMLDGNIHPKAVAMDFQRPRRRGERLAVGRHADEMVSASDKAPATDVRESFTILRRVHRLNFVHTR